MKIEKELLVLSREHHISLSLANKAINTYLSADKNKIYVLCQKIEKYFKLSFQQHFSTEEKMLFGPLMNVIDKQGKTICEQLIKEHKKLLDLSLTLSNNPEKLLAFGELLKQHTRTEDRVIFPNIALITNHNRQQLLASSDQHNMIKKFNGDLYINRDD